jgi:hypothetical protein
MDLSGMFRLSHDRARASAAERPQQLSIVEAVNAIASRHAERKRKVNSLSTVVKSVSPSRRATTAKRSGCARHNIVIAQTATGDPLGRPSFYDALMEPRGFEPLTS